jgi:hypothetical protein
MSRKDYRSIAEILRYRHQQELQGNKCSIVDLIEDFMVMLKRDNPRFKSEKFRAYIVER